MRRTGLLILAALLISCGFRSPAERLLDDYLTRLARVLRQPVAEVVLPPLLVMPAPRELQVTIEPLSIDLLDYWAFRECGMASLLGERNSVLGQVMQPSQALLMDGRLLRQLAICENQLQDEAMLQLTRELIQQKSEQWPLRYWNATIASPELRQFWSSTAEPLEPAVEESYRTANAALAFLARLPDLLYSDDWPDSAGLEHHYQQLESYQLGGRLLQSLRLGSAYIASANRMLNDAITESALCPRGFKRRELEYARNVMTQIFVGRVQAWFATLNRDASAVLNGYERLIDAQAADLQPRIASHRYALLQSFDEFRQLNREHVKSWQKLFESCNSQAIPDSRSTAE